VVGSASYNQYYKSVVLNVYKQKTPRLWGLMWLIIIYRWII